MIPVRVSETCVSSRGLNCEERSKVALDFGESNCAEFYDDGNCLRDPLVMISNDTSRAEIFEAFAFFDDGLDRVPSVRSCRKVKTAPKCSISTSVPFTVMQLRDSKLTLFAVFFVSEKTTSLI